MISFIESFLTRSVASMDVDVQPEVNKAVNFAASETWVARRTSPPDGDPVAPLHEESRDHPIP